VLKEPIILVWDAVKSVERKALKKSKLFLGFFTLNDTNLLNLAGALLVIYIIAFFVAKATFQREEISTVWK